MPPAAGDEWGELGEAGGAREDARPGYGGG